MSFGQQLPLGQRIPASIHAVSVSIPTMDDVIGYEEKRPSTMAELQSGYPRFVVHRYLKTISEHWKDLFSSPRSAIWLTASDRMAKRLQAHLAPLETTYLKHDGVSGLRIPDDDDANTRAKLFLQHIGGFLSSRAAEDYLIRQGLLETAQPEATYAGDAEASAREQLAPLFSCSPDDLILANNGMNAFFSAFEAVRHLQARHGKNAWVKLGWLYTDTMHILDKLSGEHAENFELLDIFDLDQLETALQERGHEIAGIVTEAPTNPMIQTMDLERISDLATKHQIYLIVDPTVCSPRNIDVAPYADIIVNSLTKYAGHEGDVMLGAIAATSRCPLREDFLRLARETAEPAYARDLSRIAYQLPHYESIVEQINQSTKKIVAYLEAHPAIKKVYWSGEEKSRASYQKLARREDAIGGLLSFELTGPLAAFYDAVPLPKGPSFGMRDTLLCPYIYLAHYALVTSESGRALLAKAGISPELIRLSIGLEPADQIIQALDAALPGSSAH
ncbi:aminotransferase class I/II-fold pyridoxal phosphate-dependent enzyme [Pelagicoccus sp. SDUM812003]|uniref:aminotransferase class I/II-fold pyridoxal phosphate-dependent enzyme n=1 Tax=Pelagicoccus sp. SDUM812003 TaxID=3041267 RepID=UPI00280CB435|nr:aminotransferase class I/II-fold pyridoxal phosphate-dependent enzyme [Pelagicoccus sp. SDUM812003]MDQ8201674.1 aminotransferase class I/II-fold pyridoxal phosphate-dependent enzyme [Pelagicoccus sp. SDUM812003]